MSYGSTSYGSSPLGGLPGARFVFFSPTELVLAGTYRRTVEYSGVAEFFEVLTLAYGFSEDVDERIMRIFSYNDPSETPQLQVTVGLQAERTQSIVVAARFIEVEVEMATNSPSIPTVLITGNEYFQ